MKIMAKRNWALIISTHSNGSDFEEAFVEFYSRRPSADEMIRVAASALGADPEYVDAPEYDEDNDSYVEVTRCSPSQVLDISGYPHNHPEFNECAVSPFLRRGFGAKIAVYHGTRVVVDGKRLEFFALPPTQDDIERLYDSDEHDHDTEFLVKNRKLLVSTWRVCPACKTAYRNKPQCDMQVYEYNTTDGTHYGYLCENNPDNDFAPPEWGKVREVQIYGHAHKPGDAKGDLLDWSDDLRSEFRLKSKGRIIRRRKPLDLGGM